MRRVRTMFVQLVPKVFLRELFITVISSVILFANCIFLGYELTGLIGGSIFIENIFTYPGIGQLFFNSISSRDYSVILALLLIFGMGTLLGTLISDIIMSIVDPRIRVK